MQRRRRVAVDCRLGDGVHVRIEDDDARQPLRISVLVKLFVCYQPRFCDAGTKFRRFVQQADFAHGAVVRHDVGILFKPRHRKVKRFIHCLPDIARIVPRQHNKGCDKHYQIQRQRHPEHADEAVPLMRGFPFHLLSLPPMRTMPLMPYAVRIFATVPSAAISVSVCSSCRASSSCAPFWNATPSSAVPSGVSSIR